MSHQRNGQSQSNAPLRDSRETIDLLFYIFCDPYHFFPLPFAL